MILFGQEISSFEMIGFVAGIIGVWLTMKESIWNFPIGLINVIASLVLFYRTQLYSDTFQQAIYIVLLSYGWYKWAYGDKKKEELHVSKSSTQLLTMLLFIAIVGIGCLHLPQRQQRKTSTKIKNSERSLICQRVNST